MAVYVDDARIREERVKANPVLWCFLVADSLDELEAFARNLKFKPGWRVGLGRESYYRVTSMKRRLCLARGAKALSAAAMRQRFPWLPPTDPRWGSNVFARPLTMADIDRALRRIEEGQPL